MVNETEEIKRLNDVELAALTAIVNSNAVLMDAENKDRFSNGYAAAYTFNGDSDEELLIKQELRLRGVKI